MHAVTRARGEAACARDRPGGEGLRSCSTVVTSAVASVKLQIANYFLLTANPINEISSTITGLAVSKK